LGDPVMKSKRNGEVVGGGGMKLKMAENEFYISRKELN
jgi:hypothetical protein